MENDLYILLVKTEPSFPQETGKVVMSCRATDEVEAIKTMQKILSN